MEPLVDNQWHTLVCDRDQLAADIKRATGLKVIGWSNGRPEFEAGLPIPWDRIGMIAMGLPRPPGPTARPGPVQRKPIKKPGIRTKAKRKRGD